MSILKSSANCQGVLFTIHFKIQPGPVIDVVAFILVTQAIIECLPVIAEIAYRPVDVVLISSEAVIGLKIFSVPQWLRVRCCCSIRKIICGLLTSLLDSPVVDVSFVLITRIEEAIAFTLRITKLKIRRECPAFPGEFMPE